jgi:hypothetical protein
MAISDARCEATKKKKQQTKTKTNKIITILKNNVITT